MPNSGRSGHEPRVDIAAILLALAAGCVAAAQVGKVPPAIAAIGDELSMNLVQLAWVASGISAVTAVAGVAVALAMARLGAHVGLLSGLGLLLAGSLIGARAPLGDVLTVSRLIEGAGFVLVVVSAPSLIAASLAHDPRRRRTLLAVWSCYMPTGIALMMGLAPFLIEWHGWRGLWWWNVALLAGCLALVAMYRGRLRRAALAGRSATPVRARRGLSQPGPWLMGLCFGCFSAIWFMIATWLPSFAVDDMGYTARGAAWLTALAVAGNIGGNLGAGFLAHIGLPRWAVLAGVQLMLGVLGWTVFTADADPLLRSVSAVIACAAAGALPATVMGGVPVHARSPEQIVVANGIVFQCGNLGSLAGPPAIAAAVTMLGGWDGGRWLIPALALVGIAAALALRAIERRMAEADAGPEVSLTAAPASVSRS